MGADCSLRIANHDVARSGGHLSLALNARDLHRAASRSRLDVAADARSVYVARTRCEVGRPLDSGHIDVARARAATERGVRGNRHDVVDRNVVQAHARCADANQIVVLRYRWIRLDAAELLACVVVRPSARVNLAANTDLARHPGATWTLPLPVATSSSTGPLTLNVRSNVPCTPGPPMQPATSAADSVITSARNKTRWLG